MSKTPVPIGPRISVTSEYPKTLVHPAYAPAVIVTGATRGAPARFSPVIVHNPDQEEEHRAKGYVLSKPAFVPTHPAGGAEYAVPDVEPDDLGYVVPQVVRSTLAAPALPPPLSEEHFDRAKIEARLNPASRALLERRKATADFITRRGWVSLTQALQGIASVVGGSEFALDQFKAAGVRGWLKGKVRCRADGKDWTEFEPNWFNSNCWAFDKPDGDTLFFDREKATQIGIAVPKTLRASVIEMDVAGIEEIWPGAKKPQPQTTRAESEAESQTVRAEDAKGHSLSEAAPAQNLPEEVKLLAEWIFALHPRDGGAPQTHDELLRVARPDRTLGAFTNTAFRAAFRAVYKSKSKRPPAGGWQLREPYLSRLNKEK